jgi:hypothetical protein
MLVKEFIDKPQQQQLSSSLESQHLVDQLLLD